MILSAPILPSRLRVALVLTELRPGGMERVVVHLVKGLAERGIEVLVVCLQGVGQLASELDPSKIRLVALNSFKGKDLWAVFRLRKVLIEFQPTVINAHDYSSLPYVVFSNALSLRVPVSFTAHGLLYEGFDEKKRRNRFFARFISSISAVSAKVADRHCEYLGWNKSVEIIANGVPESSCEKADQKQRREEIGCKPFETLFLAVGNPRPEKGFEDLIDAVALLCDILESNSNFMVVVAGSLTDSDYCQMLLRRVEERKISNRFKFLGYCEDMTSFYSSADAFVLSSRSEGLPMVILEAMMNGLPIVATRVGGIPDAVGSQVLLVEPEQPLQLALAMKRLMEENGLSERLSLSGRRHVKESFGVDRMVDEYIRWYESLFLMD